MSRIHQKGGEPSHRMLRVGELVRHAVSEILSRGDLNDAALAGQVVTVSRVKMSPDLKCATVFILPLGGKDREKVLEALENHRKTVRGDVARKINMKFAPDIRFRLDDSFDNLDRIGELLSSPKVAQDLKPHQTAPADRDNN